eukprot:6477530-Amphidinium_carterae.1
MELWAQGDRKRRASALEVHSSGVSGGTGTTRLRGWPVARRGGLRLASIDARTVEDKRAREKCLDRLAVLVEEAQLPAAQRPGGRDVLLGGLGRGRRAGTLQNYIKVWRRARDYFVTAFGTPWPKSVDQVIALFRDVVAGGASANAMKQVLYALSFLEQAGEVSERDRFSTHRAVQNFVEEAAAT